MFLYLLYELVGPPPLRASSVASLLTRRSIRYTISAFLPVSSHKRRVSVKIPAGFPKTREALSQYIAPPPASLKKLLFEEPSGTVLYYTAYNNYFRTNSKLFAATDFIAELLQHLPERGARLIRRYGLYSSRARGT